MTHKQFLMILAIWFAVIVLLFATPARSADVGIVQTTGAPTCAQAKGDLLAVGSRYIQLQKELAEEKDPHFQLVIKVQTSALSQLGGKIIMWRTENCKNS